MRKELIILYDSVLDDDIEKEYIIYTRDELIKHIQINNINIKEYCIDIHAPMYFIGDIKLIKSYDESSEFFIIENEKLIREYLY